MCGGLGFKGLGVWSFGFRGFRVACRGLGFRGLESRIWGHAVWGFRSLGLRVF